MFRCNFDPGLFIVWGAGGPGAGKNTFHLILTWCHLGDFLLGVILGASTCYQLIGSDAHLALANYSLHRFILLIDNGFLETRILLWLVCIHTLHRKILKCENILSPNELDCDYSVQWHLNVWDLISWFMKKKPKEAPQNRLVCYDHMVVGSIKFRKKG